MGSIDRGDGGDMSHPIFFLFNVTPMGDAWKESTTEGLRPPQYSERGGVPGELSCTGWFGGGGEGTGRGRRGGIE